MMTKCPSKIPTLLTRSGREGSNDNQMFFKETKFMKQKWLRRDKCKGAGVLGVVGVAGAGPVLERVFRMKLKSTKKLTWKLYTETVQTSKNSLL